MIFLLEKRRKKQKQVKELTEKCPYVCLGLCVFVACVQSAILKCFYEPFIHFLLRQKKHFMFSSTEPSSAILLFCSSEGSTGDTHTHTRTHTLLAGAVHSLWSCCFPTCWVLIKNSTLATWGVELACGGGGVGGTSSHFLLLVPRYCSVLPTFSVLEE